MRTIPILAVLVALGCETSPIPMDPPPSGGGDGGSGPIDAGGSPDEDAARPIADASLAEDAGAATDGGRRGDAGRPVDAGGADPDAGTPSSDLLFHSSLDDVASITSPAVGTGSGATVTGDFVPGRVGMALRADDYGDGAILQQVSGGIQNIELDEGTLEFWYRPAYDHDDGHKYAIVGTGNWFMASPDPGAIHLGKHNSSNSNAIYLILYDAAGTRWEHNVAVGAYGWSAGDWVLVRITWDMSVPSGEQNLHLYFDGVEAPLTGQVARGPKTMPAEDPGQALYIGSRRTDPSGCCDVAGLHDEIRIWSRAIAP